MWEKISWLRSKWTVALLLTAEAVFGAIATKMLDLLVRSDKAQDAAIILVWLLLVIGGLAIVILSIWRNQHTLRERSDQELQDLISLALSEYESRKDVRPERFVRFRIDSGQVQGSAQLFLEGKERDVRTTLQALGPHFSDMVITQIGPSRAIDTSP